MTEENKETSPRRVDGINSPKSGENEEIVPEEEVKEAPKETKSEKKEEVRRGFDKKYLFIAGAILAIALIASGSYLYFSKKKTQKQETKTTEEVEEKQQVEPVPDNKTVYVRVNEGLRLRENPSYQSKTLLTLPYGAKLTVFNEQGDWYGVNYEEKTGWCIKYYTTTEKPKELSIRDVDFSKIISIKEGLNELQPVQYVDFNKDGYEEALVSVLFDGTGSYKEFYVYGYKDGLVLTKYLDLRPSTSIDAFVAGYMGHDTLDFAAGKFVLSYPIYKKDDPNCCPTGGKEYVYFEWDGKGFVLKNKVNG
jgi:hypothetical protein